MSSCDGFITLCAGLLGAGELFICACAAKNDA